ncbi:pseudouridine-5'-phosphate glycosidase, partial [Methylobacterium nigriterrae]|uniref:pseudouridine-5'-phosphate glycosidase n=1 Tax=Methylobacterium nigriterrae TaxID=3127512 RepID=UPI0030139498
ADEAGVTGKAVTPFLLSRILALTGGRSLVTNIALVKNNAALAARLAAALQGPSTGEPPITATA